jgi:hypothetical protein
VQVNEIFIMPYIAKEGRPCFDQHLKAIGPHTISAGDLNYCITSLVHYYLKAHGKSYGVMNDCIGVLDAAKMEFYRRVVVPYEDIRIEENGDMEILDKR